MDTASILHKQEINWDLLRSRFPEIAYHLSYGNYQEIECFLSEGFENGKTSKGKLLYQEDVLQEVSSWRNSLNLEDVDVLYLYGIGLGHYYTALKPWLGEKKDRRLIFFEEDLAVLSALFQLERGKEILLNPQVFCFYLPSESLLDSFLEQCFQKFMSDRVEWSVLLSYLKDREKVLKSWRLKLLRKSASSHAGIGEALHYYRLMKNIATNVLQLPHSFHANSWKGAFKGVPAIICGAGVSLSKEAAKLKEMENEALLIACGSAITAFGYYGIRPHFSMAVDPNLEEYSRLRTASCFETSLIYSSRIHQDVLPSTNLSMGYLCSATGGVFEAWLHEKLGIDPSAIGPDLGVEALSVTTLAVAFAKEMGCSPILFCGVDLSYGSLERYCAGVMSSSKVFLDELSRIKKSSDQLLRKKNGEGKFVHTLVKWVMEASCIGSYAKMHPEVSFFNVTKTGLPIENVKTLSLEEFRKEYCQNQRDLRGRIWIESQKASLKEISASAIHEVLGELMESFERVSLLFEEALEKMDLNDFDPESSLMILRELDLQEEVAYQICLSLAFSVYQRLLQWWYPSLDLLDPKEGKEIFLQRKKHLWKEGRRIALECLSFLKTLSN